MSPPGPIARRFQAAAATYHQATAVQREIAETLAWDITAEGVSQGGRVLELGCGGGYLTQALLPRLEPSLWIASDIAPAMLTALREDMEHPALTTALIDASWPDSEPGFDLVCSSLTLQWLADPAAVVDRWRALVRPGGLLAFSTLLDGTFGQWRQAVIAAGAPEPGPAFTALTDWQAWLGPGARIRTMDLVERHADGLAFLKAARKAGVDASLQRTLSAGAMRRALKSFEAGGATITYRAALIVLRG